MYFCIEAYKFLGSFFLLINSYFKLFCLRSGDSSNSWTGLALSFILCLLSLRKEGIFEERTERGEKEGG